jgi:hypothetical protein
VNWIIESNNEPVKKIFVNKDIIIFDFYITKEKKDISNLKNILKNSFPGYPKTSEIRLSFYLEKSDDIFYKKKVNVNKFINIEFLSKINGDDDMKSEKSMLFEKKKKKSFLLKDQKKKIRPFLKTEKNINPYHLYTFNDFMKNYFDIHRKNKSSKSSIPSYSSNAVLCTLSKIYNIIDKGLTVEKNITSVAQVLFFLVIIDKKNANSFTLKLWDFFYIACFLKICIKIKGGIIKSLFFTDKDVKYTKSSYLIRELLTLQVFLSGVIRSGNPFAI